MGETHFLFGSDRFRWDMLLSTAMGRAGLSPTDPVDVGTLRRWIGAVQPPAGLRTEVVDLVICAWAVLHTRAWYRYGSPVVPAPAPGSLANDIELRPEPLPASGDWEAAVARASAVFGTYASKYLTGPAVTELTQGVGDRAKQLAADASDLVDRIEATYKRFGIATDAATGRLTTARAGRDLISAVTSARDRVALVELLGRFELPGTPQAMAKSLQSAKVVAGAIREYPWDRLNPLRDAASGADENGLAAKAILDRLQAALMADELAQSLQPALKRAEDEAFQWLAGPKLPPPVLRRRIATSSDLETAVEEVRVFVSKQDGRTVFLELRVDG